MRYKSELILVLGAMLFAFNGVISKLLLTGGISPWHLTQIRCTGAFIVLATIVFLRDRQSLLATRKELPQLALYGLIGIAAVQVGYFIAIARMHVSIALIIEFTAPIWIVLWLRFVRKSFVPRDMWVAIALAFTGLLFVAQIWKGQTLDTFGMVAALLDAFALAYFFLQGEKLGKTRSTQSLVVWGFGTASLGWLIALPVWNFPVEIFTKEINLQGVFANYSAPGWVLLSWVIIMGTIFPYLCIIAGLKKLSASTTSVIGMLEPVMAGVFAWLWLSERLTALQLLGGAIVIVGILLADKARIKSKQLL